MDIFFMKCYFLRVNEKFQFAFQGVRLFILIWGIAFFSSAWSKSQLTRLIKEVDIPSE